MRLRAREEWAAQVLLSPVLSHYCRVVCSWLDGYAGQRQVVLIFKQKDKNFSVI